MIDNPETARQFDDIRWYLCHENVVVFIEKDQWYIGILNRCKHLQPDNRCGIYETRPKICRSYSTDNCDFHGGEYDFQELFTSAEQLQLYAEKTLREARRSRRKKPRRRKAAKRNLRGALAMMGAPTPSRPANGKKRIRGDVAAVARCPLRFGACVEYLFIQ